MVHDPSRDRDPRLKTTALYDNVGMGHVNKAPAAAWRRLTVATNA